MFTTACRNAVSNSRSGQHLPNEISSQPRRISTDPSPPTSQETEQETEKSFSSFKSPTIQRNQWDGNRLLLPTRLALLLRKRVHWVLPMSGYLSWPQMFERGYPTRNCSGSLPSNSLIRMFSLWAWYVQITFCKGGVLIRSCADTRLSLLEIHHSVTFSPIMNGEISNTTLTYDTIT